MSLSKKISKIKNLKGLKPDKRWEQTNKFDLLAEISSQNRLMRAQKLTTIEKVDLFVTRVFNRLAPSITKMVVSFLIVVMGSGVGFVAQASVPGEVLWPVKRSMERAELTLTFSPIKETEIHIKHINKRLVEIDKILEEENNTIGKQEKKEKAIKQVVSHLEKDITSVDTSLKVVKEEKQPLQIVELAQKVTDVTKGAVITLEGQAVESQDKVIEEALDTVKMINQEVQKTAVDIALQVHEEILLRENIAEINTSEEQIAEITSTTPIFSPDLELNSEEIAAVKVVVSEIIASEIEELSVNIADIQQKVEVVIGKDLDVLTEQEEVLEYSQETLEDIDNIKINPDEAKIVLDEAKVLLEEGSLKDALDKVIASKELNDKSEVILDKLDDLTAVNNKIEVESPIDVNDVVEFSSSTLEIIKPIADETNNENEVVVVSSDIKEEEL